MSATQRAPHPARSRSAGLLDAADWLSFAAAPSFAALALLAGFSGGHQPDALCAASPGGFSAAGMVPMYAMMRALHLRPWFKLMGMKGCSDGRI